MFLLSVKLSPKRILVGAAALVLVVGIGITGANLLRGEEAMTSVTPTGESATEKTKPKKVTLKSNEDRVAFIQSFGWELTEEPVEVLEVIIPEEFDEVYEAYNTIQKQQGYDLQGYSGKRCKRYSYIITNHPSAEEEVRCNLLQYGDKVIGGDVCSTAQDGFMHGFAAE